MGWVPEGGLAVMMERQQQILPGSEEGGGVFLAPKNLH